MGLALRSLVVVALLSIAGPAARAELRPDFRVRVGGPNGPDRPVFSEGRAWFVDADGRVHAVDTVTGREVWEAPVRCGHDAFLLHDGHIACASAHHPRVLVLSARDGKLIARESIETGEWTATPVAGTIVFHDHTTGRLLGYDVGRLTWTFDHGTEADATRAGAYTPLTLGSRYLFTEEEWRTLRAVDVHDARLHAVARAAIPVRVDRGRDASISHGLLLSRDDRGVQAFDIAAARRAWRLDVQALTGAPKARVLATANDGERLLVLVEVPDGSARSPEIVAPARWPMVLVVGLRDGVVRAVRPVATEVPPATLPHLIGPQRSECGVARVIDLLVSGPRPVVTVGADCDPRRSRFPQGLVIGLAPVGEGAAWTTPSATAERLVAAEGAIYGLWGGQGIAHGERVAVELDPDTGAERARALVGYTPTWAVVEADQLWVGTTSGTVVVFAR